MKTFVFIEKNGNGSIILSADNSYEACDALEEKVIYPSEWIVEAEIEDDEDE